MCQKEEVAKDHGPNGQDKLKNGISHAHSLVLDKLLQSHDEKSYMEIYIGMYSLVAKALVLERDEGRKGASF